MMFFFLSNHAIDLTVSVMHEYFRFAHEQFQLETRMKMYII